MRAGDTSAAMTSLRAHARAPSVRGGTSFLLTLIIAVATVMGLSRVRASTEILELGAEITELTSEQSRLLELQRRLGAERAYLRHPDRIEEVARGELGMIPVSPELVQQIRVVDRGSEP